MKSYLLIPCLTLLLGSTCARAQSTSSGYEYCKCIEDYSFSKHIDDYYTSEYKSYKAWKKEMKRKKKECQAKALEHDRPMAARRKRREAERKVIKRDKIEQQYLEGGHTIDYWY